MNYKDKKKTKDLDYDEWVSAVRRVNRICCISDIDMGQVHSFFLSDRCIKKKKKLLDVAIGNQASVSHWLKNAKNTRVERIVAQSIVHQYNEIENSLSQQLPYLEKAMHLRQMDIEEAK